MIDGGIVPKAFVAPIPLPSYVQFLFVDWLAVELDPDAPTRMPVLHDLTGWRNREAYCYVQASKALWQARLVAELYGAQ